MLLGLSALEQQDAVAEVLVEGGAGLPILTKLVYLDIAREVTPFL